MYLCVHAGHECGVIVAEDRSKELIIWSKIPETYSIVLLNWNCISSRNLWKHVPECRFFWECVSMLFNKLVPFMNSVLFSMFALASVNVPSALQWRHNDRYGVSNHQAHDCLLNRLFRRRSKKNIKAPRHWPLWGEFTGDRWIPLTKDQ